MYSEHSFFKYAITSGCAFTSTVVKPFMVIAEPKRRRRAAWRGYTASSCTGTNGTDTARIWRSASRAAELAVGIGGVHPPRGARIATSARRLSGHGPRERIQSRGKAPEFEKIFEKSGSM